MMHKGLRQKVAWIRYTRTESDSHRTGKYEIQFMTVHIGLQISHLCELLGRDRMIRPNRDALSIVDDKDIVQIVHTHHRKDCGKGAHVRLEIEHID